METCKTQRCARSLKREACFFGRFQNKTPGHGPKSGPMVSEPVQTTWFSDCKHLFPAEQVSEPAKTTWFSDQRVFRKRVFPVSELVETTRHSDTGIRACRWPWLHGRPRTNAPPTAATMSSIRKNRPRASTKALESIEVSKSEYRIQVKPPLGAAFSRSEAVGELARFPTPRVLRDKWVPPRGPLKTAPAFPRGSPHGKPARRARLTLALLEDPG